MFECLPSDGCDRCVQLCLNLNCISERKYLKHSEESLGKIVKGAPLGLRFVKVELSSEHLHAQQGEDDDEEEEQQQQGSDGLHGVKQGCHQVTQRLPVTTKKGRAREKRRDR